MAAVNPIFRRALAIAIAERRRYSVDVGEWFDKLADYGRHHAEVLGPLCKLAGRYPTRAAGQAMLAALKADSKIPEDLHRLLYNHLVRIINREYRHQFRYTYHRYPRSGCRCSALSSFFAQFAQAAQYHLPGSSVDRVKPLSIQ